MLKYAVLKTFIQGVHEYKCVWVGDHLGRGFACSRHGRCLALLFLWEVRNRFFGYHIVQPLAHQIGVGVLQGRGGKNWLYMLHMSIITSHLDVLNSQNLSPKIQREIIVQKVTSHSNDWVYEYIAPLRGGGLLVLAMWFFRPNTTKESRKRQQSPYPFSSLWSPLQFLVQKLLVLKERTCEVNIFQTLNCGLTCIPFVPRLQSTNCTKFRLML